MAITEKRFSKNGYVTSFCSLQAKPLVLENKTENTLAKKQ